MSSFAGAADNLIGADRKVGIAFLMEEYSPDDGISVDGCLGYGKTYIFVVGKATNSAYLFELTASFITNVATVELTSQGPHLIEAMGGIATYAALRAIIDQLATAPSETVLEFARPFSADYLSQIDLRCAMPPDPPERMDGARILEEHFSPDEGILVNGCRTDFEFAGTQYTNWSLLVLGRESIRSLLIDINDEYILDVTTVGITSQEVRIIKGGGIEEKGKANTRAITLQLAAAPFDLMFDFDRPFSDEFISRINLRCEMPYGPK